MTPEQRQEREAFLHSAGIAERMSGKALTRVDLTLLRSFHTGGTWLACENGVLKAPGGFALASFWQSTDLLGAAMAHNAFEGLLELAEEALENRRNTPAFQPKAKIGDIVWTWTTRSVQSADGERNIGYRVLVEERKIEEIVQTAEGMSYVVFRGRDTVEALTEAELEIAKSLQATVAAAKAYMAEKSPDEPFIDSMEEKQDRRWQ